MAKGQPIRNSASDEMVVLHGRYKGMKKGDAKLQLKKDRARMYEFDTELIKGRFRNLETPGRRQKFSVKMYAGQDPMKREFVDGEVYEIPRMLARFINKECYFWRYIENKQSGFGVNKGVNNAMHDGSLNAPNIEIREPVHRFAFIPMSFDSDDIGLDTPSLTRVEMKLTNHAGM
jgi:hypothetical protein